MEFLKSYAHPDELVALLKFKFGGSSKVLGKYDYMSMRKSLVTCFDYLNKTSRSFAAVIQALDGDLRYAVCIFYLVLRALDTVEDDMTIPTENKVQMLKTFHKNLDDPEWRYTESREKDRIVLADFPTITAEFHELSPLYQHVISDICQKMGHGMTVFLKKGIDTTEQWDEYCHYVAGLVGIGLSRLFTASDLEDPIIGRDTHTANNMGLFLQKTNIIRDYLEDVREGREFWPKQVWGKYVDRLPDFASPHHHDVARHCLNELITNALELVPSLMEYLSRLHNQSVINFCAIPQVMAIATLERCYDNPAVFTGVVKIRKGEAVKLMLAATSLDQVKAIFTHFISLISARIPPDDPHCSQTRDVCTVALVSCQTKQEYTTISIYPPLYVSCAMMVTAIAWNYWSQISYLYDMFSGT